MFDKRFIFNLICFLNLFLLNFIREKGRCLIRYVELCTIRTQITEFLLQLCIKLNCCISLVSTTESSPSTIENKCLNIDCPNCTQLISNENNEKITISVPTVVNNKIARTINHQNVNRNKIKNENPVKRDPMKTRLKLRNERLSTDKNGGSKAKVMRLDSNSKRSTDSNSIDININENMIEIFDEEIVDETLDKSNNNVNSRDQEYTNPINWTINDVCEYLKRNNLNDTRIFQLLNENVSFNIYF